MKKNYVFFILFFVFVLNANAQQYTQERKDEKREESGAFRRDYSLMHSFDTKTDSWGENTKIAASVIFNAGNSQRTIILYMGANTKLTFQQISNVEQKKNKEGEDYQELTVLSDKGIETILMLFDNRLVIANKNEYGDAIMFSK